MKTTGNRGKITVGFTVFKKSKCKVGLSGTKIAPKALY